MIRLFRFCFLLIIISSCENRLPWEKRYDELITFDKNEEIKRIENLPINLDFNCQDKIKPRGKFYAFDKLCDDCDIVSSRDINLHLEKADILAFDKDSIAAFILYIREPYTNDQDYQGVQGLQEHCRVVFINPKTYAIEYVILMAGEHSRDKVYVRRGQRETVSNSVGPLPIVNAIKE